MDRKTWIALLFGVLLLTAPLVRVCAEDEDADDDDYDYSDDGEQGDAEDDAAKTPEPTAVIDASDGADEAYKVPDSPGVVFLESFQDGLGAFKHSSVPKFNGVFEVGTGKKAYIPGDKGMIIPQKAKFYAASAVVPGVDSKKFALQYEARFDGGLTCSGAYLKLPTEPFSDPTQFDNGVTYSVMFGPDKCGGTSKIHFIFQSKNPNTGAYTEHHLKNPPSVPIPADKGTHLFTLAIDGDSYEILVNGESKSKGSLAESFEPPVQPAEEIDDPEDKKPSDWVDEKKIPDPDASKPDDWDEDAPKDIPDEDAEKPEGWLDDEPETIPDPEAEKPEDWDDEEDGDWEAPTISNPACEEVGCGEWKRPTKPNPAYKGKWSAPMIDNPEYKGEWSPRQIPNPEYYKVDTIELLPVTAVGVEVWVMDHGILFDNILLADSAESAKAFADATWALKKAVADKEKEAAKPPESKKNKLLDVVDTVVSKIEAALQPIEGMMAKAGMTPILDKMVDIGIAKPVIVATLVPPVLVLFMLVCVVGGKKKKPTDAAAEAKKTDAVSPDDAAPEGASRVAEAAAEIESKTDGAVRRRRATSD